ncbi:MAG: hypothetical protein WCF25_12255 [Acidimicrobiales bacterium]
MGMRQSARPKFGASGVLHSLARGPRAWRATRRGALVALALGGACLGLATVTADATTTTTLPPTTITAGNAYARHLLGEQPVPPHARTIRSLPTPDGSLPIVGGTSDVRSTHHFYLIPASFQVDRYVRAHLPTGEAACCNSKLYSPSAPPVYTYTVSPTCDGQHITFCVIYYVSTRTKSGAQELAITAEVSYLPILNEKMPTFGTVTVTGYGTVSIFGSKDPTSIVLTHGQALALRSAIEGLKDLGVNSGCMEDALLLKIKIVKDATLVWSATADECPGALTITSTGTDAMLDTHGCSFWHVVDSFFPTGAAKGTKAASSQICSQ